MRRIATLGSFLALAFVLSLGSSAHADDFGKVKRKFLAAYATAGKDAGQRGTAVELLAGSDSRKSFKLALGVAQRDTASQVQDACATVFASYKAAGTLSEYAKAIAREKKPYVRVALARGVVAADHARRAEFVRALLADHDDPGVQLLVMRALAERRETSFLPALVETVKASASEPVLTEGSEVLGALGTRDQVMPGLLAALKKTTGPNRLRVRQVLAKIAGGDWGNDPQKWNKWWRDSQMAEKSGAQGPSSTGVQVEPPPRKPPYYGIPIDTTRVVFVIDNSGSMKEPVSPAVKQRLKKDNEKEEKRQEAVITGQSKEEAEKRRRERKKRVPVDWSKVNTKMDLAKVELVRAIRELPEEVWFGVVIYSTGVNVIEPGLVPATEATTQRYIAQIEKLGPTRMTNIIGALIEAFKLFKGGMVRIDLKPDNMGEVITRLQTDSQLVKKGADTIFFLTDGKPTWSHTMSVSNRTVKGSHQNYAGDNPNYINEICNDIASVNRVRRVRIHTIGIGDHDKALLERLAKENRGIYKDMGQ